MTDDEWLEVLTTQKKMRARAHRRGLCRHFLPSDYKPYRPKHSRTEPEEMEYSGHMSTSLARSFIGTRGSLGLYRVERIDQSEPGEYRTSLVVGDNMTWVYTYVLSQDRYRDSYRSYIDGHNFSIIKIGTVYLGTPAGTLMDSKYENE